MTPPIALIESLLLQKKSRSHEIEPVSIKVPLIGLCEFIIENNTGANKIFHRSSM